MKTGCKHINLIKRDNDPKGDVIRRTGKREIKV
jgi:hypothetical protein